MRSIDLNGETASSLHRAAGARGYRATDAFGVEIDPVPKGRATRLAFGAGLQVSVVDQFNEAAVSETIAPAGRMLSLFLEGGSCLCAMGGAAPLAVLPGQGLLGASLQDYECSLRLQPGRTYRFVAIGFDDSLIRNRAALSQADDPLLRLLDLGQRGIHCDTVPLPLEVMRLAAELSSEPLRGACGALLAEARTLEIVARMAAAFAGALDSAVSPPPALRLSSGDVDRLHEARRLIETQLETPMPLVVLASRVGLNVNKLKAGFKQLFGCTVTEHAIEARLAAAHELLRSGDLPVSSVAYRVGYEPAHFSVAFKRRFGVQPRKVARARP